MFFLQAERSIPLISARWFVRYSVLGSHLVFSFLKARTGDGGFTVTARSGGLLCFGAVSLESCFYRHIITHSALRKLSVYGRDRKFLFYLEKNSHTSLEVRLIHSSICFTVPMTVT